jgi:hypothetical protein
LVIGERRSKIDHEAQDGVFVVAEAPCETSASAASGPALALLSVRVLATAPR